MSGCLYQQSLKLFSLLCMPVFRFCFAYQTIGIITFVWGYHCEMRTISIITLTVKHCTLHTSTCYCQMYTDVSAFLRLHFITLNSHMHFHLIASSAAALLCVLIISYVVFLTFCFFFFNFLSHLFSVHLSFRDVLPFTLKLPEAIASAKTQKELEEVAQLGAGSLM